MSKRDTRDGASSKRPGETAPAAPGTPARPGAPDQEERRRRNVRLGFLSAVAVFLIIAAILLRAVLTPVLIALVLAYVADPLLGWCERHRIRRVIATTFLYITCLGLITLLTAFLGPRAFNQTQKLYRYVSGVARNYGSSVLDSGRKPAVTAGDGAADNTTMVAGTSPGDGAEDAARGNEPQPVAAKKSGGLLERLRVPMPQWEQRTRKYLHSHADEIASKIATFAVAVGQNAIKGLSSAASFAFGLILVLVYTFFFMLHFRNMTSTMSRYIPASHRKRTLEIVARIDAAVSNFFRGRLLVCLISSVVYVIGLSISGIDFWLLIGLAGGILGFIPFIGVILSIIPACTFALLTDHPWRSLIGVLLTFSIVQWIVEPLAGTVILSRQVKMHPVTLLIALLIGGYLFGIFGILLSVPLAAVVKILGEEFVLPPLRDLSSPRDV